jgi:Putative peptidoglycan binding domain
LKLFKKETLKMSSSIWKSSVWKGRSFWKGLLAIAVIIPALTIASVAQAALKLGDRGEAVRSLQDRLEISADGVYGPDTESAVLRYQALNGLTEDGIAGAETLSSLGLDPDSQPDSRSEVFLRAPGLQSSEAGGPYRVVVPGTDPEELSRVRQVISSASIETSSQRGGYIDAGGYASRSAADDVARELQNLNLEARVDFRRS